MPVRMVDISGKQVVRREAVAVGEIRLKPETLRLIKEGRVQKGDPTQIATLAGVQGAKLTPMLMPLCHPLGIESTDVTTEVLETGMRVTAKVVAAAKTGVEMEALTAVAAALLNVWDVTKQYEKTSDGQYPTTTITNIRVLRKVKEPLARLREA